MSAGAPGADGLLAGDAPVEIAGRCDWTDYLEAQRVHERRQRRRLPGWRLLWGVAIAMLAIYAAAALLVDARWWPRAALPALVIIGILVRRHVWMPWACRRMWDRERTLREPFRTVATPDAIRSETGFGSSISSWSLFERWAEGDTLFLLYYSDAQYGLVPKRLIAGDDGVARFRALLTAKLGAPS